MPFVTMMIGSRNGKIVRTTYFDGLHLVPGHLELQEFEHETPKALTTASASGLICFSYRVASAHVSDADYDVVVIDCPPQFGFLTLSVVRGDGRTRDCPSTNARRNVNVPVSQHDRQPGWMLSRSRGDEAIDWMRYRLRRPRTSAMALKLPWSA